MAIVSTVVQMDGLKYLNLVQSCLPKRRKVDEQLQVHGERWLSLAPEVHETQYRMRLKAMPQVHVQGGKGGGRR